MLILSQDRGFILLRNTPMVKLDSKSRAKSRKNTRKQINLFLTQMALLRMLEQKILTGVEELTQIQTSKEILYTMAMFALVTIKVKIQFY